MREQWRRRHGHSRGRWGRRRRRRRRKRRRRRRRRWSCSLRLHLRLRLRLLRELPFRLRRRLARRVRFRSDGWRCYHLLRNGEESLRLLSDLLLSLGRRLVHVQLRRSCLQVDGLRAGASRLQSLVRCNRRLRLGDGCRLFCGLRLHRRRRPLQRVRLGGSDGLGGARGPSNSHRSRLGGFSALLLLAHQSRRTEATCCRAIRSSEERRAVRRAFRDAIDDARLLAGLSCRRAARKLAGACCRASGQRQSAK